MLRNPYSCQWGVSSEAASGEASSRPISCVVVLWMLNLNLTHLIDDAKCYETVRFLRWQAGICSPKCSTQAVIKRGKDTHAHRQRYQCKQWSGDCLPSSIPEITPSPKERV